MRTSSARRVRWRTALARLMVAISVATGVVALDAVSSVAQAAGAARESVAVLGTGRVGAALGPRLAALGHPVIYGSREPQRADVQALVSRSGPRASAASIASAASVASAALVTSAALVASASYYAATSRSSVAWVRVDRQSSKTQWAGVPSFPM